MNIPGGWEESIIFQTWNSMRITFSFEKRRGHAVSHAWEQEFGRDKRVWDRLLMKGGVSCRIKGLIADSSERNEKEVKS